MKRISLIWLVAMLALGVTCGGASAAPGALKFSPKKPAAGERVTVTGKGFKRHVRYRVVIDDKARKGKYRTSRRGKIRFSFRMPQLEFGDSIVVAVKSGKRTRLAEIFIADDESADEPDAECADSPYPPDEDGNCSDWDDDGGFGDDGGGEGEFGGF